MSATKDFMRRIPRRLLAALAAAAAIGFGAGVYLTQRTNPTHLSASAPGRAGEPAAGQSENSDDSVSTTPSGEGSNPATGGAADNPSPAATGPDVTPSSTDNAAGRIEIKNRDGFIFPRDSFFILRARLTGSLLDTLIPMLPENLRLARSLASSTEEALHYRMDTRSRMSAGDEATIVFKEGDTNEVMRLFAVRYMSKLLNREFRLYYFWELSKTAGEFFDDTGAALIPRLDRPPIPNYRIIGPLVGKNPALSGIDFYENKSVEAVAPFKSRVQRINWLPKEKGRCVELAYLGTGVDAIFLGLESLSVRVNPGAEIPAGAVIGKAGKPAGEGAASLHYELRMGAGDDAPRVDPFQFHGQAVYRVPETENGAFVAVKQKVDSLFREADELAALEESPTPSPSTSK